MCVALTKKSGFDEVEGKDVDELLQCCDNDSQTDKSEQLREAYMALTKLNVLMKRIIMMKKQQSVK
jgi:hypothetical protein